MVTIFFAVAVLVAVVLAFRNWRLGWYAVVVIGILQDPARKLTAGMPVQMTFTVVLVYVAILVSAYRLLQQHRREFSVRFANIYSAGSLLLLFIAMAAVNGVASYGLRYWSVPVLSLVTYLLPLPAVLVGYAFVNREEDLYKFLRFYAFVTSVALIGTMLEYFRVSSPALGLVSMKQSDILRHIAGINVRMLAGFYRAPDIMAWHAATLTTIGLLMTIRAGIGRRSWPWIAVMAWGFLNAMLSGRRKAILYLGSFAAVFVWRFFRRMRPAQIVAVALAALVIGGVVHTLSEREDSRAYVHGAQSTRTELLQRFEGGAVETVRQFGWLGAGLGAATQGAQHLAPQGRILGWQEAGLGKLVVELGVPGVIALAFFGAITVSLLLRLTAIGDVPGSSQLLRAGLFAFLAANVVNFMSSAQAYSDPVLTLLTAFMVGALFATATLDERLAQAAPAEPSARTDAPLAPTSPAHV